MVVSALLDYFGLKIGLGTVSRLRNQGSEAVSIAVEEAKVYVQNQRIVGADETGFKQGNADAKNPEKKKAWLWVAVTPLVTLNKSDVGSFDRSRSIFIGRKV
jgi:transposase